METNGAFSPSYRGELPRTRVSSTTHLTQPRFFADAGDMLTRSIEQQLQAVRGPPPFTVRAREPLPTSDEATGSWFTQAADSEESLWPLHATSSTSLTRPARPSAAHVPLSASGSRPLSRPSSAFVQRRKQELLDSMLTPVNNLVGLTDHFIQRPHFQYRPMSAASVSDDVVQSRTRVSTLHTRAQRQRAAATEVSIAACTPSTVSSTRANDTTMAPIGADEGDEDEVFFDSPLFANSLVSPAAPQAPSQPAVPRGSFSPSAPSTDSVPRALAPRCSSERGTTNSARSAQPTAPVAETLKTVVTSDAHVPVRLRELVRFMREHTGQQQQAAPAPPPARHESNVSPQPLTVRRPTRPQSAPTSVVSHASRSRRRRQTNTQVGTNPVHAGMRAAGPPFDMKELMMWLPRSFRQCEGCRTPMMPFTFAGGRVQPSVPAAGTRKQARRGRRPRRPREHRSPGGEVADANAAHSPPLTNSGPMSESSQMILGSLDLRGLIRAEVLEAFDERDRSAGRLFADGLVEELQRSGLSEDHILALLIASRHAPEPAGPISADSSCSRSQEACTSSTRLAPGVATRTQKELSAASTNNYVPMGVEQPTSMTLNGDALTSPSQRDVYTSISQILDPLETAENAGRDIRHMSASDTARKGATVEAAVQTELDNFAESVTAVSDSSKVSDVEEPHTATAHKSHRRDVKRSKHRKTGGEADPFTAKDAVLKQTPHRRHKTHKQEHGRHAADNVKRQCAPHQTTLAEAESSSTETSSHRHRRRRERTHAHKRRERPQQDSESSSSPRLSITSSSEDRAMRPHAANAHYERHSSSSLERSSQSSFSTRASSASSSRSNRENNARRKTTPPSDPPQAAVSASASPLLPHQLDTRRLLSPSMPGDTARNHDARTGATPPAVYDPSASSSSSQFFHASEDDARGEGDEVNCGDVRTAAVNDDTHEEANSVTSHESADLYLARDGNVVRAGQTDARSQRDIPLPPRIEITPPHEVSSNDSSAGNSPAMIFDTTATYTEALPTGSPIRKSSVEAPSDPVVSRPTKPTWMIPALDSSSSDADDGRDDSAADDDMAGTVTASTVSSHDTQSSGDERAGREAIEASQTLARAQYEAQAHSLMLLHAQLARSIVQLEYMERTHIESMHHRCRALVERMHELFVLENLARRYIHEDEYEKWSDDITTVAYHERAVLAVAPTPPTVPNPPRLDDDAGQGVEAHTASSSSRSEDEAVTNSTSSESLEEHEDPPAETVPQQESSTEMEASAAPSSATDDVSLLAWQRALEDVEKDEVRARGNVYFAEAFTRPLLLLRLTEDEEARHREDVAFFEDMRRALLVHEWNVTSPVPLQTPSSSASPASPAVLAERLPAPTMPAGADTNTRNQAIEDASSPPSTAPSPASDAPFLPALRAEDRESPRDPPVPPAPTPAPIEPNTNDAPTPTATPKDVKGENSAHNLPGEANEGDRTVNEGNTVVQRREEDGTLERGSADEPLVVSVPSPPTRTSPADTPDVERKDTATDVAKDSPPAPAVAVTCVSLEQTGIHKEEVGTGHTPVAPQSSNPEHAVDAPDAPLLSHSTSRASTPEDATEAVKEPATLPSLTPPELPAAERTDEVPASEPAAEECLHSAPVLDQAEASVEESISPDAADAEACTSLPAATPEEVPQDESVRSEVTPPVAEAEGECEPPSAPLSVGDNVHKDEATVVANAEAVPFDSPTENELAPDSVPSDHAEEPPKGDDAPPEVTSPVRSEVSVHSTPPSPAAFEPRDPKDDGQCMSSVNEIVPEVVDNADSPAAPEALTPPLSVPSEVAPEEGSAIAKTEEPDRAFTPGRKRRPPARTGRKRGNDFQLIEDDEAGELHEDTPMELDTSSSGNSHHLPSPPNKAVNPEEGTALAGLPSPPSPSTHHGRHDSDLEAETAAVTVLVHNAEDDAPVASAPASPAGDALELGSGSSSSTSHTSTSEQSLEDVDKPLLKYTKKRHHHPPRPPRRSLTTVLAQEKSTVEEGASETIINSGFTTPSPAGPMPIPSATPSVVAVAAANREAFVRENSDVEAPSDRPDTPDFVRATFRRLSRRAHAEAPLRNVDNHPSVLMSSEEDNGRHLPLADPLRRAPAPNRGLQEREQDESSDDYSATTDDDGTNDSSEEDSVRRSLAAASRSRPRPPSAELRPSRAMNSEAVASTAKRNFNMILSTKYVTSTQDASLCSSDLQRIPMLAMKPLSAFASDESNN